MNELNEAIPEGWEIERINPAEVGEENQRGVISVVIKKREPTFNDYAKQYIDREVPYYHVETLRRDHVFDWAVRDKLGLLWFILRKKGGGLSDWVDLMAKIEDFEYDLVSRVASMVFDMLHPGFIEALKQ
jgi:hypothetical protein